MKDKVVLTGLQRKRNSSEKSEKLQGIKILC